MNNFQKIRYNLAQTHILLLDATVGYSSRSLNGQQSKKLTLASITVTAMPNEVSCLAAARPDIPAPMISTLTRWISMRKTNA